MPGCSAMSFVASWLHFQVQCQRTTFLPVLSAEIEGIIAPIQSLFSAKISASGVGSLANGSNEGPPAQEDAINLEFYRLKWHCKCVFTEKEARPKPSLGPVFRLPHARPSAPSSSWNDGKLQITAEQLPYVTREQKTVPMTAARAGKQRTSSSSDIRVRTRWWRMIDCFRRASRSRSRSILPREDAASPLLIYLLEKASRGQLAFCRPLKRSPFPPHDLRPPSSPFLVGGYLLAEPGSIMSGHKRANSHVRSTVGSSNCRRTPRLLRNCLLGVPIRRRRCRRCCCRCYRRLRCG